jgi:hypothetical protein
MDFLDVRLALQADAAAEMRCFYCDHLGFAPAEFANTEDLIAVRIGKATLRFSAAPPASEPFYHFALLAPGDRFEAGRAWLADRTELLPDPDTGDDVFDFDNWDALACYCLDPVGNIVEVIAHHRLDASGSGGAFRASEFLGFSELGLVVPDKPGAASQLARKNGIQIWDGELDDPKRLVFLGERGRTLILSPADREWLPTDRPAEPHAVEVVVTASRAGVAHIPGTKHRVESRLSSLDHRSRQPVSVP